MERVFLGEYPRFGAGGIRITRQSDLLYQVILFELAPATRNAACHAMTAIVPGRERRRRVGAGLVIINVGSDGRR